MSAMSVGMCCLGFSIYRDEEAHLAGEQWEGGLSLLSDGVIAAVVPSLPTVTPLMVTLSKEEVFLKSEGFQNCRCGDDISTSIPKLLRFLVLLQIPGLLGFE